jgi:hypothetical protein
MSFAWDPESMRYGPLVAFDTAVTRRQRSDRIRVRQEL